MTGSPTPLIAGNWKMHGSTAFASDLAGSLAGRMSDRGDKRFEMLLCPPALLLGAVRDAVGTSSISVGGQDCHTAEQGAHTGDISAAMLADAGCSYVIVGHSERRADHGEDDSLVCAKASAAQSAGLVPVVCIGETLEQRDAGKEQLTDQAGIGDFVAFVQALRESAEIVINEEAVTGSDLL